MDSHKLIEQKKANDSKSKSSFIKKLDERILHISILPNGNIGIIPWTNNAPLKILDADFNVAKTIPYPYGIDGFNQDDHGIYYHISFAEQTLFDPVKLNFDFKIRSESRGDYIMKPKLITGREFACFYSTRGGATLRVYDFDKGSIPVAILGSYKVNESDIVQISPQSFAVASPLKTHFFQKIKDQYVMVACHEVKESKANSASLVRLSDKRIAKLSCFQEIEETYDAVKKRIKIVTKSTCEIQIWDQQSDKWQCTSQFIGPIPDWPDSFQASANGDTIFGIISHNGEKKIWAWDANKQKGRTFNFEDSLINFDTLTVLPSGIALYAQKKKPSNLVVINHFVEAMKNNIDTKQTSSVGLFGDNGKKNIPSQEPDSKIASTHEAVTSQLKHT